MSEPTVRQRHVHMAYCWVTYESPWGIKVWKGCVVISNTLGGKKKGIALPFSPLLGKHFLCNCGEIRNLPTSARWFAMCFTAAPSMRLHSISHLAERGTLFEKVFLSYTFRLQIVRWGSVATRPTCLNSTKTWQPSVGEALSLRFIASWWCGSRRCLCHSCRATAESASVYQGVWEKNSLGWFQSLCKWKI